ncbi:MAG TPA: MFS transporter [Streptosporangiaceae bacterium]|nr:MFS transporter [Streptosporangiaceae bacterium]
MAGEAAAGAYSAGAVGAPRGSAGPGEAQPVLTGRRRWGSKTFGSLQTRNYRLFAAGQVVSNTGSWMQRVAQDWLVLQLTHDSGTALGITTGLQFLPLLLFGLWGGVIADRYSKRGILMVTQAAMGGLALLLGTLALTGSVRIWQVYLLAFALGMVTVVDNPTRQAFAVEMVGADAMANAIALNSAVFNLARIAGPAVAGLVIGLVGTPAAFLINAASYGAVLIGLKLMRPDELHQAQRPPRGNGQLREALSYVRARPGLWMPLILLFFVSTFGMNFQVTTALMSRTVFHTGAGAFGFASAMFALGALGGALLAARRSRPTLRLLLATSFAFSVFEIVTGLVPSYLTFLFALVPTGVAMITYTTAANSSTQLNTAPEMRGRVMGLYMLVFLGGTPLGSPLAGWVAEVAGARLTMIAGGVISMLATVAIAAVLARNGGVRARSYARSAELARSMT